jgi:predicted flap endonuclease-1-like 5' DNA nuclease
MAEAAPEPAPAGTAAELVSRFSGGNFPLSEVLGIDAALAQGLAEAGYRTFDDIMDLEEGEIRGLPGMTPEAAKVLMDLIEELTVEVEEEYDEAAAAEGEDE